MIKKLRLAVWSTAVVAMVAACSSPSDNGNNASGGTSGGSSQDAAQKAAKELGIDLSQCPEDITKPLTGTVKVGTTLAQTGPIAVALAPVGVGENAAIKALNASSGLPVQFSLTQVDDQFAPDKTVQAVQQLIQSDKVDILDGVIGTANVTAIHEIAEQNCVPLVAANSSGATANAPSKYPFTVTWSLPSYVDAKSWITHLTEQFPDGAKVAVLTANTDTGKDYLAALDDLVKGTKIKIVSKATIEATDTAAPSAQVTTLKASGANVLLGAPSPSGQCAALINEVANQGWKPDAFMMTSQCSPVALVAPAKQAAEGVLCNLYINDPNAPGAATNAGVKTVTDAVQQSQPGAKMVASTMTGYSAIEVLFEAAKQAEKSPLGLSRLGILYAATHMKFQSVGILDGVTYDANYKKDEVTMEAAQLSSFDSAAGAWKKVKLYDFNGQTTGKASS